MRLNILYTFVRNEIAALHFKHVVNSKATDSFSKGYSLLLEFNVCTAVCTLCSTELTHSAENRNASPKVVRGKRNGRNQLQSKKTLKNKQYYYNISVERPTGMEDISRVFQLEKSIFISYMYPGTLWRSFCCFFRSLNIANAVVLWEDT